MNLLSRKNRIVTDKKGRRALAKALANAPTRGSREELLLLRNR